MDRESTGKKLADFFSRQFEIMLEMRHLQRLYLRFKRYQLVAWLASKVDSATRLCFWLAIIINTFILGCYQVCHPPIMDTVAASSCGAWHVNVNVNVNSKLRRLLEV